MAKLHTSIKPMTIAALAAIAAIAQAQMPYRAYSPPGGPTLPYQLDYFRPQSGVLDQYNQFVAPKEQLATQIGSIVQQQGRDYQAVEKQIRESDRIRESQAAATGTAGGFMNYSHYYGKTGAAGTARAGRQSRQYTPSTPFTGIATGFGS
jgi:hypothetical protein